jgi:aminoglycoside 3-N-acetyltransferase
MVVDGRRQRVEYPSLDEDESDFVALGEAFAATGAQATGPVGAGIAHLMRARDVVDFATAWMRGHRATG